MVQKIDFVVTWVDNSDKGWRKKKNQYREGNLKIDLLKELKAYRDWGTLKYWFRGVEKYANWVNKVYLVTDNQVPNWINLDNHKLQIVDHKDFIPYEALPVFNSNAIEINVHKIEGLSENFVLFNDDMFLINNTEPSDFFKKNLPRDILALSPIIPQKNGTGNFQVNDMEIINYYFSKKDIIKKTKAFSPVYGLDLIRTFFQLFSKYTCGFYEPHLPYSFKKSTFYELWKKESVVLNETTRSKFRKKTDISVWLMRYWQLASGNFSPRSSKNFGELLSLDNASNEFWHTILKTKKKVVCINDGYHIKDTKQTMYDFLSTMEKIFPIKSSFEK